MNNPQCCVGKSFERARGKIFLAQLNEVNAATSCFRDLCQQGTLACVLVTGKLRAVGDIEKKQVFTDSSSRFRARLRLRALVRLCASDPLSGGTWSGHHGEIRNLLPASPRS